MTNTETPERRSHEAALRLAYHIFRNNRRWPVAQRIEAAGELGEFGCFSLRQIGVITRLHWSEVSIRVTKEDATGGRFAPAAIPLLLRIIENEKRNVLDVKPFRTAATLGCSVRTIARLVGMPETTVRRRIHGPEPKTMRRILAA